MSKYSCQSIQYYWCNRTLKVGRNLWKMWDSCIPPQTFLYVCASFVCMYVYVCLCLPASCLPACLAGCHVAHLLLSSCLTLGLSWISLGPRWQWSRQHRFGSCHMGRLQGNGLYQSLLRAASLVIARTHTRTHAHTHTQTGYLLSRQVCTEHIKLNKHVKQRGHKYTDDKINRSDLRVRCSVSAYMLARGNTEI